VGVYLIVSFANAQEFLPANLLTSLSFG